MDHARQKHPSRHRPTAPAPSIRYPLVIVASVLVLLAIGIAHDRGHLDLALSLLGYAAVLAVIVLASRASAE